ncbi:hypothetical protein ABW19_dt0203621 [Dactylella cylindrospora]|nr:hypothetical protein ABW19_dt0203621 [Dactylella cylindrospora]
MPQAVVVEPHQYSGVTSFKRSYTKQEDWAPYKDYILSLRDSKVSYKVIAQQLRSEKGFNVSEQNLKNILKTWKVSNTNITSKRQQRFIFETTRKRSRAGKRTVFRYGRGGTKVRQTVVKRIVNFDQTAFADDVVASPGGLIVETPRETGIPDPADDEAPNPALEHEGLADAPDLIFDYNTEALNEFPLPIENSDPQVPTEEPIVGPTDVDITIEPSPPEVASIVDTTAGIDDICNGVINALEHFSFEPPRRIKGPSADMPLGWEYRRNLQKWIGHEVNDAKRFLVQVDEHMKFDGDPLEVAYKKVSMDWVPWYAKPDKRQALPYELYDIISRIEIDSIDSLLLRDRVAFHGLYDYEWTKIFRLHQQFYQTQLVFLTDLVCFYEKVAHLETLERNFGRMHFFTLDALAEFGANLLILGEGEGRWVLEFALYCLEGIGMGYHQRGWGWLYHLARYYSYHNLLNECVNIYMRIYQTALMFGGPADPVAILYQIRVSEALARAGDTELARTILGTLFDQVSDILAWDTDTIVNAQFYLQINLSIGRMLRNMKEYAKAIDHLKGLVRSLAQANKRFNGMFSHELASALISIGCDYYKIEDFAQAIYFQRSGLECRLESPGSILPRTLMIDVEMISRSLERRGLVFYMVPILERTLEICKRSGEEDSDESFQLWLMYSTAKFQLSGHGDELKNLKQLLLPGWSPETSSS